MRKYISGILVIAIMVGVFAASAAGTSAKADAQYDLDDPEQRLAYEMTFLTGSRSMERTAFIVDKSANLTIFSTGKADIHIVIHDLRTNMTPLLGFSIKSQLGSASTLLNAGATTNITYKVDGMMLSDEDIDAINAIKSHLERLAALFKKGCSLEYSDIDNPVFRNNLQFLDICMPQFIADCLLVDSKGSNSSIDYCVADVAKKNPFDYKGKNVEEFYAHKMKVLLLSAALGMVPGKEWTGRYDANGGYLVVRKDGEIVCYHFYNQNDVEDYLYKNTRFERASRTRYGFGKLYRGEDGSVYMKLNLQIRFKK